MVNCWTSWSCPSGSPALRFAQARTGPMASFPTLAALDGKFDPESNESAFGMQALLVTLYCRRQIRAPGVSRSPLVGVEWWPWTKETQTMIACIQSFVWSLQRFQDSAWNQKERAVRERETERKKEKRSLSLNSFSVPHCSNEANSHSQGMKMTALI